MRNKILARSACLILLSVLSASLLAEGSYMGASVGQVRRDKNTIGEVIESVKWHTADETSTGWKAFWGYQFTPYMGAEVFYADLGEFNGSFSEKSEPGSVLSKATGIGVAGTLTWPVNGQFGLYGKSGFLYWNASLDFGPKSEGTVGLLREAWKSMADLMGFNRGFSPLFGIGAKFSFNDSLSVNIEWERYLKVGKKYDFKGMDIDLISAGVMFSF